MTDKEKLYCAMLHLACFVDDAKKDRGADFSASCACCRLFEKCKKLQFYENVREMAESVGVLIGPLIYHEDYRVHLEK